MSIFSFPDRYLPVILFLFFLIWSILPSATKWPPWIPAFGPTSIIKSAKFIVSSSCSTMITVLPRSFNLFRVDKSFLLSLWCKPIDGSSKTYRTPVKPEPICEASLIRWDSPPDNVPDVLDKVK